MIQLRHATVEDAAVVLALWAEAGAEPSVTDDVAALRALLDHAPEAVLLAADDDGIVGTIIIGWDGWRGGFYRLAVLPRQIESRLVV